MPGNKATLLSLAEPETSKIPTSSAHCSVAFKLTLFIVVWKAD